MPYSQRPEGYNEKLAENRTAMFSDLYTWAMSQALYTLGLHEIVASFDAHVRSKGQLMISGGQNITAEYLDKKWMDSPDSTFDRLQNKYKVLDPNDGQMKPIFTPEFIDFVKKSKQTLTIDMLPEGSLVYGTWANVRGPIWQGLIAEDYFLNPFNSQTRYITKAARLKIAAGDKPIIEMGLRRGASVGGLEASRAAYIGGMDYTSNMEAWETYDIPMTGTVAHAGILFFGSNGKAIKGFGTAVPHNTASLPDTFGDTLAGLREAIQADEELRAATGLKVIMKSARLDSGELVYLSNECRKILDEAGLHHIKVVATNELNEKSIMELEQDGSADIYGVGTQYVMTDLSVGSVYKLNTVFGDGITQEMIEAYEKAKESGAPPTPANLAKLMREVIKLGEKPPPGEIQKATYPGEKIVLRTLFKDANGWRYDGDIVFPRWQKLPVKMIDNPDGPYEGVLTRSVTSIAPNNPLQQKTFRAGTHVMLPLKPMFDKGALVGMIETVHEAKPRVENELALLAKEHKSLTNAYPYGIGLEKGLYDNWKDQILAFRAPKP